MGYRKPILDRFADGFKTNFLLYPALLVFSLYQFFCGPGTTLISWVMLLLDKLDSEAFSDPFLGYAGGVFFAFFMIFFLIRDEVDLNVDKQEVKAYAVVAGIEFGFAESFADYPYIVVVGRKEFGYHVCFAKPDHNHRIETKRFSQRPDAHKLALSWALITKLAYVKFDPLTREHALVEE